MDKRLVKNIIFSIGYNLLTIIVPFVTAPHLARVLGAERVGSYTYVQSIASYFLMFGLLGMRSYGNRTIARVRDSKNERSAVFWQLYYMQILTGMIAFSLYLCYLLLFDHKNLSLSLIICLYVATGFLNIDWFCDGMEDFSSIAKRTLLIKVLNLIFVFAFVRSENDLDKYCIIMSAGYLASAGLLWPSVLQKIVYIRPKIKDVVRHLRGNILLFIPTIAASVYQIMDKIMIGRLAGEAELAYYEYAEKITQIPMLLFTALGAVMLSRMSHVFSKDDGKAFDTLGYSMDLSFTIGSSFCFGLAAIANELVLVYYGFAFSASGSILITLTPMILLYGWANVIRMQYVIPNNLDYVYISSTIIGAFVNLIFNLIFIPRYHAIGAAVGTLAAQLAVAIVFTVYTRKRLPLKQYFLRELPLVCIGLVMGICVFLFSRLHAISIKWLLIDVVFGCFLFGIMYIIFGVYSSDNLAHKLVTMLKTKI